MKLTARSNHLVLAFREASQAITAFCNQRRQTKAEGIWIGEVAGRNDIPIYEDDNTLAAGSVGCNKRAGLAISFNIFCHPQASFGRRDDWRQVYHVPLHSDALAVLGQENRYFRTVQCSDGTVPFFCCIAEG